MPRLAALLLALIAAAAAATAQPLTPVPFHRVRIADTLFRGRTEANRRITIPAGLNRCAETGRLRNFAVAGGLVRGKGKIGHPLD